MKLRFLLRIVLEAETALAVGSGNGDIKTDRLVCIDANGLPFIPGTSLAGALRHAITRSDNKDLIDNIFGYQEPYSDEGLGSRIIFSSGVMIGKSGKVMDGLQLIDYNDDFYSFFNELPVRQHVRISEKGVHIHQGKFDNQVVYAGTRFCFEIEFISENIDEVNQLNQEIIDVVLSPVFRLGGGTRKGYGSIKVIELKKRILSLDQPEHLEAYLSKTSELNDPFWEGIKPEPPFQDKTFGVYDHYMLALDAEDFFLFGSGHGSMNADITYVTEAVLDWSNNTPEFKNKKVLIPASSVKGALLHRTAYHYNKHAGIFADQCEELPKTNENDAVKVLFGTVATKTEGQPGRLYFSDVYLHERADSQKLMDHVAIDRFTGGAIAGALFKEEVYYGKDESFNLNIWLEDPNDIDIAIINAFEDALKDLCMGRLPLGGGTMRGHGVFIGQMFKNGNAYEYESRKNQPE